MNIPYVMKKRSQGNSPCSVLLSSGAYFHISFRLWLKLRLGLLQLQHKHGPLQLSPKHGLFQLHAKHGLFLLNHKHDLFHLHHKHGLLPLQRHLHSKRFIFHS